MLLNIEENAIFIADSHYNTNRDELKQLLLQIQSKQIITSQLFLVGDIFDFLDSEINFFKKQNQEIIDMINNLSLEISVIYLEGNHDFNLKNIFSKAQIISRQKQPLNCKYKDKNIKISHGDMFMPLSYEIFSTIFRNKYFLKFLDLIDINYWLSQKINNNLSQKEICNKCNDFKKFAQKRLELYNINSNEILIEGHFHYGEQANNYINIPSLACSKKYIQLKDNNFSNI